MRPVENNLFSVCPRARLETLPSRDDGVLRARAMVERDRTKALGAALAVLVIAAAFVSANLPRIFLGASEIGALMIGTPDEHLIASGLYRMFHERTLDYQIPVYGGFYPNFAFLLLKAPLRTSGQPPTEHALIIGLRAFSLIFGALTIGAVAHLTWLATRRALAPIVAAGLLVLTPELTYWSVRIHPDTLLLLNITLTQTSLLLALRRRSQRWVFTAFVLAILATMTKLVGMFFLPWILLVHLLIDEPWLDWKTGLRRLRNTVAKATVWFVLIAYATTPTLLVSSRQFFHGVESQMKANVDFTTATPEYGWVSVLVDPVLVGPVALVAFLMVVAGLIPPLVAVVRRGRSALRELSGDDLSVFTIVLFPAGYLGYLFISTRLYEVRYAMPALPSIAVTLGMVAAAALPRAGWLERLHARFRWLPIASLLVITAVFAAVELPARQGHVDADLAWLSSRDSDPRLDVGYWLSRTAPDDSMIIYDYGVFVPHSFAKAEKTFGLLKRQVTEHRPDYLLLHDERRAYFDCAHPRAGFEEVCETLALLDAGKLYDYAPSNRFDTAGITVYTSSSGWAQSDLPP